MDRKRIGALKCTRPGSVAYIGIYLRGELVIMGKWRCSMEATFEEEHQYMSYSLFVSAPQLKGVKSLHGYGDVSDEELNALLVLEEL